MKQAAAPIKEQVRDVMRGVTEAMQLPKAEDSSPLTAFRSPDAEALKAEIVCVGRKLWGRQYVDGNGGNITVRVGSKYVLCTPTLLSKGDLETDDICLCDLDGNILAGDRTLTSELLLHLEIYKANEKARAVVHCHPPYATAFAMTGTAPPLGLIPEYEVFIGPAAVAPYETPGTQAFCGDGAAVCARTQYDSAQESRGGLLVGYTNARGVAVRDHGYLLQDLFDCKADWRADHGDSGRQDRRHFAAQAMDGLAGCADGANWRGSARRGREE